jgi:valyl-tRNA synthetase
VADWPIPDPRLGDQAAHAFGETLVGLATAVRRYKSENGLPLGTELVLLQLSTRDAKTSELLRAARDDIKSVTRARHIEVVGTLDEHLETVKSDTAVRVALKET